MSGATVSINPKLPNGTIVQVGGVGFDDFYANLVGFVGLEAADAIVAGVKAHIAPGSLAPAQPQQLAQQAEAQALNVIQGAFGGAQVLNEQRSQPAAPPGGAPIGNNGLPKRWVPPGVSKKTGKPYQGFWAEDDGR